MGGTKKSNSLPGISPFLRGKNLPEFSPNINLEDVISLRGDASKKAKLLKNYKGKYLNFENSCIQFGKMQSDGNTVYSTEIIKPFIKYIINHAKLDEKGKGKVLIQLWPELAQSLSQGDGKKVLTFDQEKEIIKDITNECGEEGKNVEIEIQNVADNYSDVFNAIKDKGKDGIILKEEPKLEDFKLLLKSPLPIIQYLAYHCVNGEDKDENGVTRLMRLFYGTKPAKYKEQDGKNHIPGTSDADYYAVVEVGIRLFEVLNGKYVQGGIDRQKVYDKIIYLILFGEDKISGQNQKLKLEDYPKLGELHNRLMKCENYKDPKMMQLYIDLGKVENDTEKQESKREKEQSEIQKGLKSGFIKHGTIIALIGVLSLLGGKELSILYSNHTKNEVYKTMEKEPLDTIVENTINTKGDIEHFYGDEIFQEDEKVYMVNNTIYFCIRRKDGDKTILLARKANEYVYSLKNGINVANRINTNKNLFK